MAPPNSAQGSIATSSRQWPAAFTPNLCKGTPPQPLFHRETSIGSASSVPRNSIRSSRTKRSEQRLPPCQTALGAQYSRKREMRRRQLQHHTTTGALALVVPKTAARPASQAVQAVGIVVVPWVFCIGGTRQCQYYHFRRRLRPPVRSLPWGPRSVQGEDLVFWPPRHLRRRGRGPLRQSVRGPSRTAVLAALRLRPRVRVGRCPLRDGLLLRGSVRHRSVAKQTGQSVAPSATLLRGNQMRRSGDRRSFYDLAAGHCQSNQESIDVRHPRCAAWSHTVWVMLQSLLRNREQEALPFRVGA